MGSFLKTLVNGRLRDCVSPGDRGFQYGDGVFETITVLNGAPRLWDRHIRRLLGGCERLGFRRLPNSAILAAEAQSICTDVERGVLKIIVTRGHAGRGYAAEVTAEPTRVVAIAAWPDYPKANAVDGVAVRHCRTTLSRDPQLAGTKHLNRLAQIMARAEWGDEYAEGLMSDTQGNVIEGTMSNIFLVHRGAILTPDLSETGVAGVMRELVMERAGALGMPVTITTVGRTRLAQADELFLTNSLIGIWPVTKLETRQYHVGEITRKLQQVIAA